MVTGASEVLSLGENMPGGGATGTFSVPVNLDQPNQICESLYTRAAVGCGSYSLYDFGTNGAASNFGATIQVVGLTDASGNPITNFTMSSESGHDYVRHIPGDINGDGLVDVADYNIWAANIGATGQPWSQGDLNGDGLVDVADYNIWAANVGNIASTPEPATLSLLVLGGLAMLKRRK